MKFNVNILYLCPTSSVLEKSDIILFIIQLQVDNSMLRLANAFKYQKVSLNLCYLSDIFLMKKHLNCRMALFNLYRLLKMTLYLVLTLFNRFKVLTIKMNQLIII